METNGRSYRRERGGGRIRLAWALCAAVLLARPLPGWGAFGSKSAGTSGAAFLKIGAGARPTAMGEAFTGVADDVNAISWNAAGLATLPEKKNEFVAMRADLFQDLQYNYFAFAHPTRSWGTFAVALNNLSVTDIEQRTADTDAPDSTFSSNDTAYSLAYARRTTLLGLVPEDGEGGLSLGGSAKYIRQTLAGETANSTAFDVGALYRLGSRPLSAGLSLQNLGTKAKFKGDSDPLPMTLRMGASYRLGESWRVSGVEGGDDLLKRGFLVALDGHFPRDNDPSARLGAEFTRGWTPTLASSVRAGYQTGRERQTDSRTSGISAGAGVNWRFASFDFAWVPFGNLGNTFRYSVKLRF